MPVIGITGGIASGKSTFARALASALGAEVFDTDACARELLTGDAQVIKAVSVGFGSSVLDAGGQISRPALRGMVFRDSARRRELEAILHPRIRERWTCWVAENLRRAPAAILLVDIPLLYETQAQSHFDCVILVACSPGTQLRRLAERRNLPSEEAARIVASQLDLATKIRLANHVIWNDASELCLETQTSLCARYIKDRQN